MRRQDIQFTVLMGGILCFLTVSRLAQTGMFLDGLTYAAVSRNMAQGIGTFWAPSYTSTLYPRFFEQPPLGLGLQAIAFALFGDHLLVERVYSVMMGSVTALLTMAIWRQTVGAPHAWLPVFFWLLPAMVTWSIVNNMLENTQAVFTTLAVLAFVRALRPGTPGWLWGSVAGLSIGAAVLAKGPVGLFPLAAPVVLAVAMPKRAVEAWRAGSVMLVSFLIGSAVVLMQSAARSALWAYWQQAVVASIVGARERAPSRWVLGFALAEGIGLRMGGAVALAWLYAKRWPKGVAARLDPWTWFFFGLALAGSLPIAISPKIMGVYLVPSVPFYALGCASVTRRLLDRAPDSRRHARAGLPIAGMVGAGLVVASLAVPLAWGPLEARDVEWVAEYRTLSPSLPRGETLGTCGPARTNFGLHAYMQRLFLVSLDPDAAIPRRYFLQLADGGCDPPPRCRPLAASPRLALLECGD